MKKKKFFAYLFAISIPLPILILSLIWTFTYIEENTDQRVPILLYHQLVTLLNKADYYHLPASEFEKQLAWLKANNYHTINLNDLVMIQLDQGRSIDSSINQVPETKDYGLWTDKLIILTFDDGTRDHYLYAFPLLKKYDYTATFFIISSYIDTTLTEKEIKEMSDAGMSIQSHTHTHKYLDELNASEIKKELKMSKTIIESITKKPVNFLAIPGGWYDERVLKIAKEIGYKAICTSDIGTNSLKKSNFVLKRIDVPGTITIDEFKKLFSPSKIAFDHTFRQIRLALRKTIGHHAYSSLWHWYHHSNKTSLFYILTSGIIMGILIIFVIAIRRHKSC